MSYVPSIEIEAMMEVRRLLSVLKPSGSDPWPVGTMARVHEILDGRVALLECGELQALVEYKLVIDFAVAYLLKHPDVDEADYLRQRVKSNTSDLEGGAGNMPFGPGEAQKYHALIDQCRRKLTELAS